MFIRIAVAMFLAVILGGCTLSYPTHDVSTLRAIGKRPSEHSSSVYAFGGDVIDVRETSSSTQIQLLVGQYFSEYRADLGDVLFCEFPARSEVLKGDRIRVLGSPRGIVRGENAFGGSVEALRFDTFAIAGPRGAEWVRSHGAEYDAWKAGTLFTHGVQAPIDASMMREAAGPKQAR